MAPFFCCFLGQTSQSNRVQPGTRSGSNAHLSSGKEAQNREDKPKHKHKHREQLSQQVQQEEAENTEPSPAEPCPSDQQRDLVPARRFRYKELEIATANFNIKLVLGEGGFGKVYQGRVEGVPGVVGAASGGMNVAIKKLNPESIQGYEQWINEVLHLERLHHPNLVRLIGYCAEENEALLVYTLYPRGSLDKVLFEDASVPAAATPLGGAEEQDLSNVLSWNQRVRVAQDAALGLAYLHDSSVIHRDFKPSNILLASSENPAAVLTDFGMARAGPDRTDAHISTRIMGTMGYLDPLYLETGRLTYKSDTFAFGVMLLELMTGKREGTERLLSSWVRRWHQNPARDDIVFHVDWRLKGQYSRSEAAKLAQLACKCVSIDQNDRPEMSAVVDVLLLMKTS